MHRVYIDGQEGTTGLEINQRLAARRDIELLSIDSAGRKNTEERGRLINAADIVFLCLPDDAAREAVSLLKSPDTRVIDASTAHRTDCSWAYGIPELSLKHRETVKTSARVSNPGCFATGFNMLVYPLVAGGIIDPSYPLTCHCVTGYSGGGKARISEYEYEKYGCLKYPCLYALDLNHKHLPEMQKHSGLENPPLFTPIIAPYYRGMTVCVPLFGRLLKKPYGAGDIVSFYSGYYGEQRFVRVLPHGVQSTFDLSFLPPDSCNNTNNIEITAFGGDERILLTARLDNLGKGASGAAVQNMNIMLGIDEGTGL